MKETEKELKSHYDLLLLKSSPLNIIYLIKMRTFLSNFQLTNDDNLKENRKKIAINFKYGSSFFFLMNFDFIS